MMALREEGVDVGFHQTLLLLFVAIATAAASVVVEKGGVERKAFHRPAVSPLLVSPPWEKVE
jgi:hypothetical protein